MEQVRNYWKAHSSKDGEVLTASVRKASGKLWNRALNFLYPLECLVWTKRKNKIYPKKLLRILSTSNRMSQTSRKVDKNLLAWGVSQRLYATKCVTGLRGSLENTCSSRRCTATLLYCCWTVLVWKAENRVQRTWPRTLMIFSLSLVWGFC